MCHRFARRVKDNRDHPLNARLPTRKDGIRYSNQTSDKSSYLPDAELKKENRNPGKPGIFYANNLNILFFLWHNAYRFKIYMTYHFFLPHVISAKGLFYMMIVNILGWVVIKLNKQTSNQQDSVELKFSYFIL